MNGRSHTSLFAALAAGVPLVAYLASASSNGHWLDAGTFVAQAADLGIAHPPGHPLYGIVNGLAMLLPLGPLAFRVAVIGGCCAAAAAYFFFCAAYRTQRVLGLRAPVAGPLALACAWAYAGAYGVWIQAVRPEVYALQAMLLAFAIDRLVAFEARFPEGPSTGLWAAAFAFGLALANHHFLALLMLPAAAATLGRWVRERGFRPLGAGALFGLLGAAVYAYLPLRAGASPMLTLGDPRTPDRFYWTISAQAFQKNTGGGVPQPFGERFFDVIIALAESIHPATLIVGAIGAYVLVRLPRTRRLGVLWVLMLSTGVLARSWLGFVRGNPDALGYLAVVMMACCLCAASAVGALLLLTTESRPKLRVLSLGGVIVLLGLSVWNGVASAERASLASFTGGDVFDDLLRREVPPRSVLILHSPESIFRYWGGEAEERLRPDVSIVPVPLIAYPGMVERLTEESPSLRGLLRGLLLEGHVRARDLRGLVGDRPVLIELDARVPQELFSSLVPRGMFYEVLAAETNAGDRREGAEQQRERWQRALQRLAETDDATRLRVFWARYHDALYYAALGDRDFARDAIDDVLAINDQDEDVRALAAALQTPSSDGELEGPIDITPFLPQTLD